MKRPVLSIAALSASALLLAACAASTDSGGGDDSDEPIKLAVVYGLTGAFSGSGEIAMTGLNAAVDEINAAGGVLGRPFEVNLIDSRSDPAYAVTALTDVLESDDPPDVLIPGGNSPEVLALLPMATDAGLFGVSVATNPATNDPDLYPYYFGISPSTADQLSPIVAAWEEEGVETIGLILGADAIGDGWMDAIEPLAEEAGIEIVAVERPDTGGLSFDVEFQRVLAAAPDAIFSDFSAHDAVARSLTSRLTVGAIDIPLYTATGTSTSYPANLVDAPALENCSMAVFDFTVKKDDTPAYLEPLHAPFVGKDLSIYSAGLGWDMIQILALAIERSGGDLGGEALSAALTSDEIAADSLALYSTGTDYTEDNHFPAVPPGSIVLIPCDATHTDSLWVVD